MPYARFLLLMIVATLLGLGGWIYVIFFVDPFTSGWIGPVSFYLSFSMVCVGGFFLLGALFHRLSSKNQPVLPRHVRGWFRRAVLLSIGAIVSLLLASVDHFSVGVFLAFFAVLVGLEAIFLFIHQGRRV